MVFRLYISHTHTHTGHTATQLMLYIVMKAAYSIATLDSVQHDITDSVCGGAQCQLFLCYFSLLPSTMEQYFLLLLTTVHKVCALSIVVIFFLLLLSTLHTDIFLSVGEPIREHPHP